jgi:hypothetical protein
MDRRAVGGGVFSFDAVDIAALGSRAGGVPDSEGGGVHSAGRALKRVVGSPIAVQVAAAGAGLCLHGTVGR